MPPVLAKAAEKNAAKPKKIIFDEEGEATVKSENDNSDSEEDYFAKREKLARKKQEESRKDEEDQKKWFEVFEQVVSSNPDDILDMKEKEQMELYNQCKNAYETEKSNFNKRNPSDARWLQTALHKGTAKDQANAGALLVTSNPLGNLEALTTLIAYTKLSNKASPDVIAVMIDLWQEVLLPPQRKLISINMRGADWKLVRNNTELSKENQRRIYAYWYFENELKDAYFEFLKNLQQCLQTGQENNKNSAIVATSKLLAYAPEKEQMLLSMVVNKLGDPLAKVASKALHHLTEVAHRHPNMSGVIVAETEKLLFRNNISDRAQHFSLCFLASIATSANAQVCTKLVNICFALFKVLVQKGAVNNRTMQAILRCLQKAITEAQPSDGSTEILSKDMQDTIYRLVHLANIGIAVQTLGLLLQLITVKTEKSDRFYNALYKKMLDLELTNIGMNTASQLLHIIHRAIHIDANIPRAKAFIKRLLQMALYMPSQMAAGCLIVTYKLFQSRKELIKSYEESSPLLTNSIDADAEENKVERKDSDEEKEDGEGEKDRADIKVKSEKEKHKYDPYHRVPTFAGAEYVPRTELLMLSEHFHPTVQLFAQKIFNQKRITYYGDPLRDFNLAHFLERFAFKNPKKLDQEKPDTSAVNHKHYVPSGSRGLSVKSLTKTNCTEDELYILNYLEQKRQRASLMDENKAAKKKNDDDDEGEGLKSGDVDDDEFDDYLDGFFGKKAKRAADLEEENDELDFLKELGGELKDETKGKKSKNKQKQRGGSDDDAGDGDDIDADWGDDDDEDEEIDFENGGGDDGISDDDEGSIDLSDDGSISLDENEGDAVGSDDDEMSENDGSDNESDSEEDSSRIHNNKKNKKKRKQSGMLDEKSFAKKLKQSTDMSSLFAAADEFADILEETSKVKGQGTGNVVFNKDKSSDKQMKWEESRRSNSKGHMNKGKRKFVKAMSKVGGKKFSKKSKH